jgi:hypothetical protein
MSSFKRIDPADQFQSTIVANKQWTGTYSSYPYSDDYIKVYIGINNPNFNPSTPTDQGIYSKLEYDKINQLFYHKYTSSLNTQQRIAYSNNYDSASAYRATSSYFIYNENPLFHEEFPTGSGATIHTIYVNKSVYGNQILPGSMTISSSEFYIADDGYGNLYDLKYFGGGSGSYFSSSYISSSYLEEFSLPAGSRIFVGNIFYSFGLMVITAPTYQDYFAITFPPGTETIWSDWECPVWSEITPALWTDAILSCGSDITTKYTWKNEYPIYENYVYCKVKAGEFNLTYNPSLSPGTGSQVADFATGSLASGSYFTPYATTIGIYNDTNDLIMVAKLGQPIPVSAEDDMTFVIRYDT